MLLLKNTSPKNHKENLNPSNLTYSDGWRFGIGFGLAITVALPLILIVLSCFIMIAVSTFGSSILYILTGL